ncbi:hypothetical protein P691DRAFT_813187 [Macrolepiota fuliginosa MF-IS2]|uniref:Uncharacterized protein n=1 Tax=Macrolepiota fuliginosa MF-IS2 TaxID=1400762 RepID=A0A9P6C5C6_9AGAR|nr:hypothetical protein P691DRAFT_804687 [Macrolepiota fuliginosa MF-IS2]KAF9449093.1 hypothetical protein P691DRAFT_813187 [Macrolepiota fuliginosa MF-IS2]
MDPPAHRGRSFCPLPVWQGSPHRLSPNMFRLTKMIYHEWDHTCNPISEIRPCPPVLPWVSHTVILSATLPFAHFPSCLCRCQRSSEIDGINGAVPAGPPINNITAAMDALLTF